MVPTVILLIYSVWRALDSRTEKNVKCSDWIEARRLIRTQQTNKQSPLAAVMLTLSNSLSFTIRNTCTAWWRSCILNTHCVRSHSFIHSFRHSITIHSDVSHCLFVVDSNRWSIWSLENWNVRKVEKKFFCHELTVCWYDGYSVIM